MLIFHELIAFSKEDISFHAMAIRTTKKSILEVFQTCEQILTQFKSDHMSSMSIDLIQLAFI